MGVPLARQLAANPSTSIANLEAVVVGILDTTLYRDDLISSDAAQAASFDRTEMPSAVDDQVVILVDDVASTGPHHSGSHGRADGLREAPIRTGRGHSIDRGHRELPIKIDYVGKNIPDPSGDELVKLRARRLRQRTMRPLEVVVMVQRGEDERMMGRDLLGIEDLERRQDIETRSRDRGADAGSRATAT